MIIYLLLLHLVLTDNCGQPQSVWDDADPIPPVMFVGLTYTQVIPLRKKYPLYTFAIYGSGVDYANALCPAGFYRADFRSAGHLDKFKADVTLP